MGENNKKLKLKHVKNRRKVLKLEPEQREKGPFCLPVATITAIIDIIVVVEMTNTATDRAPI